MKFFDKQIHRLFNATIEEIAMDCVKQSKA
jgi:hypothetical protein